MKRFVVCLGVLLCGLSVQAQFIGKGMSQTATPEKSQPVAFVSPEQVTLPVGRPAAVALHFRVGAGLHINSHAPHDTFLIPTTLTLTASKGVRVTDLRYPEGNDVALPIDPKNKLNVYTGEFILDAKLVAEAGEHRVEGKLRYQACDQRECMPPRTIPVEIDVLGK
ncbi:protein-disulfide reductase DsbD domain-containing protein [Telmatobacter bradus]|uniref:protein-disulfide reductase DsbD domain-containing protein n=1 Tax=Telmatobacter bradus TaxID=474953 RepID=UPI003B427C91